MGTVPAATTLFNTIDTNGDGKISQAEFSSYITGATNYVQPTTNYIQQAPAVASYVQPASSVTIAPQYQIEAPATNYVKPAATISTVGRTYQPQTVIQQPSYNYVRPAASVATRPAVIQQPTVIQQPAVVQQPAV